MRKHTKKSEDAIVPNNPALVGVKKHTSVLKEYTSSAGVERKAHFALIEKLKKEVVEIEKSSVFSASLSLQQSAKLKRGELDRLGVSF